MPGLSSPVRRGPGEPVGRKSREGSNPSPGVFLAGFGAEWLERKQG